MNLQTTETTVYKAFAGITTPIPIYYANKNYKFDIVPRFAKLSIIETISNRETFGTSYPYLTKGYINLVIYTKTDDDQDAAALERDFITAFTEKCLDNNIVTFVPKTDFKGFSVVDDNFTTAINIPYQQRS